MSESAARAERFEVRTNDQSGYMWDVAGKPLAVRLDYKFIARLEHEVVESFRSVSSQGSEIGGLLLGSVIAGDRPVVVVEDYQLVPCSYARGPLYRLNDSDRERLDAAVAAGSTELAVVGFFRSNTRKGLSLDAEDLAIMTEKFRDALSIALLVRPFATRASVGGIFLWENGALNGDASALEFPFSHRELAPPAPPEAPASASPSGAKPGSRAQIVPIASRREATAPEAPAQPEPPTARIEKAPPAAAPIPAPAPAPTPVAAPVAPAPAPAGKNGKPVPAGKGAAKTVPAPVPEPRTVVKEPAAEVPVAKEAPKEQSPKAAAATAAPALPSAAMDVEAPASGGSKKFILIGVVAVVLVLLGIFVVPNFLGHKPAAPAAVPTSLQLKAERRGTDFVITWNKEADAIRTVKRAVLVITDGEQHESVELDPAQVRNGNIVYTPITADVSFQFEVTSTDPSKNQTATVRLLNPNNGSAPASNAATKAKPSALTDQTAQDTPQTPVPAAPKTQPKAFVAPSGTMAERLRPAKASELPEPPPDASAAITGSTSVFGAAPISAPAAPVAPPSGNSQSAAPQSSNVKVGGNVIPVQLIQRVNPTYPELARQAKVQGEVLLEAIVGVDGSVKNVKVLSGHPLLKQAAVEAVKRWKYKPAVLNGGAIESPTRISVGFVGH